MTIIMIINLIMITVMIIMIITILTSNVVLVNAGRKVRVIAQCVKFKDGKKVNDCDDSHTIIMVLSPLSGSDPKYFNGQEFFVTLIYQD